MNGTGATLKKWWVAVVIFALATLCLATVPVHAEGSYTATTTLLRNQEYDDALLKAVGDARRSVIFSFYLFKIAESRNNRPRAIAAELIKAARRGVEVTVILERNTDARDKLNDENRQTAALLTRGGVRVFFDAPGITSHLKTAVIDSRYVFIGSHNLTQSALQYNNELSVMIDSPEMAAEIQAYLNRL
ncbi:phospholipase D-like domain-containing protein [Geotalea sp. SG265]|uniref:phospholipase D-like domain-containing protein n=1 Tax=Geotalea sp. SG265 TaxID=2922867 RepID=UPI001FAECF92|nr:phospholipase D-like domain-containing protein [Geotalea sp. SG265]